ncbi:MAG: acyl-CoA dehydrogenase family protein, partial [Ilumatobacter sp.]|uniref:acyl-CoA dehydrogenase family protein n=1 Tax=Ilumatobacter sp. TaxID=1967498 RepID=UPI002611738F
MDFTPDEDHDAIVEAVDRVCAQFDDSYWSDCDRHHRFPWDFYDAMAAGGWLGVAIPEQYGGGGRGVTEAALVLNRIAASGAAMNGSSSVHITMFGLNPVVRFGNERLCDTFLPAAASGELHVAFGVTEPDAGTDTSRITTRAVDDGAGGFLVSGRKIWTSKALESQVCLLLARTDVAGQAGDDDRFGGLTLFLVDLDPEHVEISPIPKAGRNAVASCEVAYDELPVEGWRLVGERGRGFQHLLHGLNPERVLLAAMSCGLGEAALRRAVGYANEREVFDRPIGSNQAIAHPLAQAQMQ